MSPKLVICSHYNKNSWYFMAERELFRKTFDTITLFDTMTVDEKVKDKHYEN